ncbi:peptide deformylase [Sneathiella chinensis]|uniref:Peptide deformylase-like n=1 Tax=Sneathiella chinensis TaxID=349750 RepID=A0ABQ5U7C4_9PROT|nr:peptide deformylase [Sneathiella chinensis]GLQ07326.1 peptide deformylase [Sneathiella chinensis]
MSSLSLVIGPHPVFRQKAIPVAEVDDTVRREVADMFDVLYRHQGVGIGANMVGLLKRIIVIDLQEGGQKKPLAMINPDILETSESTQEFEEASLSFPGIAAKIRRPASITVRYLDLEGQGQEITAEGWLATVIQHEMDYLDGVLFFDHLSRLKRDGLLRKYRKMQG